jgi:hypothetical protein
MTETPTTRYAKSDGVHIAYQVIGEGPFDLLFVPGFVSNFEAMYIALHIGARVAGLAAPGEVLVSQTVRDLVAGSGLAFDDRGAHVLKGVPNKWRLFRAVVQ